MKWYSEWFGVLLVPETAQDLAVLEGIGEAETCYENGTIAWRSDGDDKDVQDFFGADIPLPLGRALELTR